MKQNQHTTLTGTRTTPTDLGLWTQALFHLHARLASHFARPEPRRRALKYLQGILSETARKNGWQLAEYAGEARPDGMQRLLSQAKWDADGVRDDLRSYAFEHLGKKGVVVVIDETSFPKRGDKSAGVGLQYCGTTGQVENCQIGVFLGLVTSQGHTLIDRELYLPLSWCENADRRRCAHIPENARFQTKPELAAQMIERLWEAAVPINWVVADTVYGGNFDLRMWLEAHHSHYVLAVACTEPVTFQTQDVRRREEVALVESLITDQIGWQRLSMSEGTKGPRIFDWTMVPLVHQGQVDGCHFLLTRRSLAEPKEKRYYLVFAPPDTSLSEMVAAIGCRWHIEEDFEQAKAMGLSHYEVRSWIGWKRHVTLVMLAHTFLASICARPLISSHGLGDAASPDPVLLPLTVPEVRHLLGRLVFPTPRAMKRALAWSWWRRVHQSWASHYHTKRRRLRLS